MPTDIRPEPPDDGQHPLGTWTPQIILGQRSSEKNQLTDQSRVVSRRDGLLGANETCLCGRKTEQQVIVQFVPKHICRNIGAVHHA
ncbi:hypothetical protein NDU88_003169 [Pleurodeles waltl]|uniref:Uncharacterized protein n=1 Tax=Pleurodeles waltl TaxID=8319 RepID=A0AAV7Q910_PLEWA|nr:hypothetical protein NDU88_003169 [Pleurodeles waltl]